jgi:2,3-bisphosphoglycerate-independent phosphoglycerate mutase
MDRDNRWERVKKAYDMLVSKVAEEFDSVLEIFDKNYEKKIYDEFIEPSVVNDFKPIIDNDSVIFFNFRHDRARELTRAFVDKDFK